MAPLFYQNLLWNLTALSIAAAFVRPARLPTRADGLFETSLALMSTTLRTETGSLLVKAVPLWLRMPAMPAVAPFPLKHATLVV